MSKNFEAITPIRDELFLLYYNLIPKSHGDNPILYISKSNKC